MKKWVSLPKNADFVKNYKTVDQLKIDAFVVATRYNLLLVDYLVRSYQLNVENKFLLPYLKARMEKMEEKDKAILISSLMLHDHFESEQVILLFL